MAQVILSEECSLIEIPNPPEVYLLSTVVWSLDLRTEGNGHEGVTGAQDAQGFPYLESLYYGNLGCRNIYPLSNIYHIKMYQDFSPSWDLRDLYIYIDVDSTIFWSVSIVEPHVFSSRLFCSKPSWVSGAWCCQWAQRSTWTFGTCRWDLLNGRNGMEPDGTNGWDGR